ncbi:hypothetical protein [Oceanicella sp. SM1341]|uniref:hypothetical protein n=1 Tax=Oceanicella sp. SM1341 TaxID=1548889 RepID=UPI000E50CF9F|nr:hypothetical protein [Oceanicella sp. SM1341]
MPTGFDRRDLASLQRRLAALGRDAPEVSRLALNDMAFAVHAENKKLIAEAFEQPTPFTLNAFVVRKATAASLSAVVERKPAQRGRHYLETQETGGKRGQTGFERLLSQRLKYSGIIQAVLPTKRLRRNRYGNVSPGVAQQILSAVQAQGDAANNTTAASAKRVGARRAGYFVPSEESRLSAGVFERRGKRIRKVLAFSDHMPGYTPRFPMEERARDVAAAAAPEAFERALARTLKRSR